MHSPFKNTGNHADGVELKVGLINREVAVFQNDYQRHAADPEAEAQVR